ncbi:methyl-accepting chemotaxis protein [Sagittula sp. NFXS13]|uniref:Methyl-accepting chemotaxis protein n=1 Tax=Sagittula marina TaxID=943940 RepID=A0A7W6DPN9_9RHOB|nr:PAS domain-containing methyl-accepting chemotaxis protein [Sagittula marina]MBB3986484.1 methyl-accepting chemotaxis protein [Sagittula marina]
MWFRHQTASQGDQTIGAQEAIFQIVERTQAVIHFSPDGIVLAANNLFVDALGYTTEEVVGLHHSVFVQRKFRETQAYQDFWQKLRDGEFFTDEFPRVTKDDKVIWLSATYAPVFDKAGKVVQVTKIATEITKQREAIHAISKGLEALSNGNLRHRINLPSQDRMREVADSFNSAVESVSTLIVRVQNVASLIDAMSQQITSNTSDLSRRTETQAATLEQTAAAVEELSNHSRSASNYAQEVGKEAQTTRVAAEDSSKVVNDVTDAMTRIENSSESISEIISVIDDIAFQTNLLALNAGVEAARAGEAGRGFAVVASEVRQLAQRSAASAQEIKSLIGQSTEHVQEGADLVKKARSDLEAIFRGVELISERIGTVVTGLQEQTSTLTEINTAVSQLDRVTQQNAAMVGETASVTTELSKNSVSLSDAISIFDIDVVETEYKIAANE